MSKHHKHKKYKNNYNYIDEAMVNPNSYIPQQNNIMSNNGMPNNGMQNNQNPFAMQNTGNNMMPNATLKSLFPNSFNSNPILNLLGNIDINLLAKLLLNNNSKTSNDVNEQNTDQNSFQELFKNIDQNQLQDLLKNVDEKQINSLLGMLSTNAKNQSENQEEIMQNEYEYDDSVVEVYDKKYKAADIVNIILALFDQKNTEFLDKVMDIYQENYVVQENYEVLTEE
ncbi:hypothetical protein CLTEP_26030 [Clostridium tepidiprofundi DSM 19306]|uniref:Uncharacterized protein n=1 Tax=Clostridium tepidiprofundi DSM 19306 TaxID=1121338 RepID=A0A151ASC8_9CLOT|nr:hypothetical protein [Clostridium tepidiprofundi]KYH30515.1 hypothetical protein CLTEP_26030 [Clostridium tepidiprofundi DSM 19306]